MGNVVNLDDKKVRDRKLSLEESAKIIKDDISDSYERLRELKHLEKKIKEGIETLESILLMFGEDEEKLSDIANIILRRINKKKT